jgi:PAS domain S-box-containing protein
MHSPHHDPTSTPAPVTAESAASQPQGGPENRQDVLRRFEALVHLAPDATVVVDGSGRIRLVNQQTEVLFGYSADELLGQPVELLIPERLRAVHQQHRQAFVAAPRVRPMGASLPLFGRRRDGSEFPLEASLGPLNEGGELLVIASIRDVTERQRLEHEREAARAEAEQQAAQLAAIFEAIAEGVVVFDAEGHLQRQNATYRSLLGMDAAPAHFADLPVSERIALFATRDEHGRPLEPGEGPMPRALRGEVQSGAETMNIRSRTPDGRELELSVSAAPLWDREGHLTGAVGVVRDQTEQKRLERERAEQAEQLDRIVEGIGEGLFVYDIQGNVVRTNAAARRLLGLEAAPADFFALAGDARVAMYSPHEGHEGYQKGFQGLLLKPTEWLAARAQRGDGDVWSEPEARDIRMRSLDGRELEVSASMAPLRTPDGQLVGGVLLLSDRTERNQLEREREAARASELAAQTVIQQLNAFLATAAHDIRTPLTVASARVQVSHRQAERLAAALSAPQQTTSVTAEAPEQLADHVVQNLRNAQDGMGTLRRLVKHLFDVAQLQTESLVLELAPCDLNTLVQRNAAAVKSAARGRRILVQVPADAVLVEADADRLDQVLGNYLTNALKYSPANQPVTVKLEVVDNQALVSVIDHGPGVPPEDQNHIWEMFYRSPQVQVQPGSRTDPGSLGLGLHICKQLIERHPGGHIGVESTVGQGSTFWFRLPLVS